VNDETPCSNHHNNKRFWNHHNNHARRIRTTTSIVFKGTQTPSSIKKEGGEDLEKYDGGTKTIVGETNDFQTPTSQRPPPKTKAVLVESETNGADRHEIRTEGGAEGRRRSSHHGCNTLHLGGRRVLKKGVRRL